MTVVREAMPRLLAEWSFRRGSEPLGRLEPAFRRRLVDFAANVVGGSAGPASVVIREHSALFPGQVPSPGPRTTPEAAALAYGVASHALECDDTHQPSSTHPGAVIFSTALPLAAELGLSLADAGRAVVVGYEVMCRLGEAARPEEQYARGFHPSGTCGVFGAAATAGVLLGLAPERLEQALGLAVAYSSGSMAFLQGGGWSKLLNVGHAASSGITVGRLAALGYQGPRESIDGPHGFLVGHSSASRLDPLTDHDFEERAAIERTSVKAHGCCRYEQGPVDALLMIRAGNAFDIGDVEAIEIGMLGAGWGIVAEPLDEKRRPSNVVESQFSMPFGAALALVRGHAAPADHNQANLADPDLQHVMDLVECYRDPGLDARFPERWPAVARVRLRDGRVLEQEVEYPKGDPENPLSDSELVAKARSFAADGTADEAASFAAMLLEADLDELSAASALEELAGLCGAVSSHA
jgi:2-methylcitrate dehydratase PrpD